MPKITEISKEIIEFLKKQDWPSTTGDIAKGVSISWQTAQIHLYKLMSEGKVKYRKVGRQNQWWLNKKYDKEMS
ncbi:MAG: helix-turn-helix transcriptional regulator [Candidatus Aenigmatarchaeota archaeon]